MRGIKTWGISAILVLSLHTWAEVESHQVKLKFSTSMEFQVGLSHEWITISSAFMTPGYNNAVPFLTILIYLLAP